MLAFNREQVDFLLENMYNHFNQEEFENGYGEFAYWKGKTNFTKLKEAFNLAFGEYPTIIKEDLIKLDGKVIGGYIIAKFTVYPTPRGMRQDSAKDPWDSYYKFILTENLYSRRQLEGFDLKEQTGIEVAHDEE